MENFLDLFFTVVLVRVKKNLIYDDVIHLSDVIASDDASTYSRGQHTDNTKELMTNPHYCICTKAYKGRYNKNHCSKIHLQP